MATVIKCPVCGNSVSGNVCDKCGWMRLVFPADVPELLKSFNSEYTEKLSRIDKTHINEVRRIEHLRASIEKELDEKKREVTQFEKTIQTLRQSLEQKDRDTEYANSALSKKDAENRSLQSQLNVEKNALEKERQAHAQSIQRIEQLQRELEKSKADLLAAKIISSQPAIITSAQVQPTNKIPKGSVIMSVGGKKYTFIIYSGDNTFTAPDGVGICGDMFRIVESDGAYKIYDTCGLLRKANGKSVKSHGEEISNGLIFTINNARIELDLPEINLDDIL